MHGIVLKEDQESSVFDFHDDKAQDGTDEPQPNASVQKTINPNSIIDKVIYNSDGTYKLPPGLTRKQKKRLRFKIKKKLKEGKIQPTTALAKS